jgi:hypothetical protein
MQRTDDLVASLEPGHAGRIEEDSAGVFGNGRGAGEGIAHPAGTLLDDGETCGGTDLACRYQRSRQERSGNDMPLACMDHVGSPVMACPCRKRRNSNTNGRVRQPPDIHRHPFCRIQATKKWHK